LFSYVFFSPRLNRRPTGHPDSKTKQKTRDCFGNRGFIKIPLLLNLVTTSRDAGVANGAGISGLEPGNLRVAHANLHLQFHI
jgi:hypothetical protein